MSRYSASLDVTHPGLVNEWDDPRSPSAFTAGSTVGVQWRCALGHVWSAPVNNRVKGRGCPYCSGRLAVPGVNDVATLRPDLLSEWADDLAPSSVKAGSHRRVLWRCAQGHEWKTAVYNRNEGTGCPVCVGRVVVQGVNDLGTTHPELAAQLAEDILVTAGSNRKVLWRCERGHEWEAAVHSRVAGAGCQQCQFAARLPVGQTLLAEWDDDRSPTQFSAGSGVVIAWRCEQGHKWSSPVRQRAKDGTCPVCINRQVLAGFNDLATTHPALLAEWDDERSPSEFTYGSGAKVRWKCAKGHVWEAEIQGRSRGAGCPDCAASNWVSAFETEVADFIEGAGVKVQRTVRNVSGIRELDILLPELGIAVECNGIYWHSEKFKDKNYHAQKRAACEAVGIRLIQVWEDDWKYRRQPIEEMLLHKLGVSRQPVVYARKTVAEFIDVASARDFLARNHIQGHASGSFYLGLKEEGTLVAVMVLKRGDSLGKILRLERYATSARVPGGQSKLIRFAERELPGWESLVTFADHEVSSGKLYESTGWVKDDELAPDYKYVYRGVRHHKFGFRLKRFRNDPELAYVERMSERELAQLNGILRVWDSGKTRYVYMRPSRRTDGKVGK